MPGSLTSRIRQLGPSLRVLDKHSCAVPKDLECKPTDSSNSWRDSRTSLSSSTMNTVGASCALIAPRPYQKWVEMKCQRPSFPPRCSHAGAQQRRFGNVDIDCIGSRHAGAAQSPGAKLGRNSKKRPAAADVTRSACFRHLPRCRWESTKGQRGAFTGSGFISGTPGFWDISLVKLKSVGAAPVINRAPRLNVRF